MFGKIVTAMVTPFDAENRLNVGMIPKLVKHLLRNNTSAILLAGSTGESPTLTDDEKIELFERTIKVVNQKVPIIANVGTNSTDKTIKFMKRVENLKIDAYLVVVPYYNKPCQEGMFQHFKKVSEHSTKPIMIYNIPSRTGVNMETETIVRLSKIKNIIGIKESSGDSEKIKAIKEQTQQFLVYTGDDHMIYDAMNYGADGVISVASHLYGRSIHTMMNLLRNGKKESAKELFDVYVEKFKILFIKPNPVCVKSALCQLGFNVGSVRLPLVTLDDKTKVKLFNTLGI